MVDIHHYLGLCIRFQHVQDIHTHNRIEFPIGIIRTVITIVPRNIMSTPFQLVRIISETTTKIKNTPFQ